LIAKKTILILSEWFLPGYLAGGPVQSINTLTKHLANDFNFKIISTDKDFKTSKPYDNIKSDEWNVFDKREVFYISQKNLNKKYILHLISSTPHDVIYLNSLYSKHFTINPLIWKLKKKIKSQIVLAPRGMLSEGALAVKPFKKKIFLTYAKWFNFFINIHWQSTSPQETIDINKRIGSKVSISEISNLPAFSEEVQFIEKKENELKLFFISRISKIKNLNFAIDVLKEIKEYTISFDVYGPIEELDYWNMCQENAKALPNNISFNYKGVLKPTSINSAIAKYHSLILPTENENFGHMIVEALQNGRMLLISDQTPWRNLENENVGFDIPLVNKQKFVDAIKKLCALNQNEFNEMSKKCSSFINKKLDIDFIKKQYINLFNS
jgi:glycosyltransferase involved in cell wall biosynthesis